MTVHAFPSPVITPTIGDARALLSTGAALGTGLLSDEETAAAVGELAGLESQAAAWRLGLTAEADTRKLAEQEAATDTDSWAAALTGDTREAANGGLLIARLLREKYAATREAFAAGRLRLDQVRVIVFAAEKIPSWATPKEVATAEEWLVAKATGDANRNGRPQNAKRLRQTARRMCKVVSKELADAHEAAMLSKESRRAENETWMNLRDNGDGTYSGRFVIPELHGKLLKAHLDRLSSPKRWTRDKHGNLVEDPTLPGTGPGLNWSEHLGAAFCETIEHLPVAGHTGGNGVTMVVKVDLDHLITGLGGATLDEGVRISTSEARRLACEAAIIPAVLGGDSVPLDLGRKLRLHNYYQRLALALTHDTCAVTGCDRPFAWCDIHHHKKSWAAGGNTDLDNGLPLCGYHHNRAHDDQFDLRQTPDGDWRFHRRR
jgi:hypothetical protein